MLDNLQGILLGTIALVVCVWVFFAAAKRGWTAAVVASAAGFALACCALVGIYKRPVDGPV
jgi:hypothetical protein